MQRNSVPYILGFCTAICLVCSVIVSTAAVGLKEKQEQNKILDRQKKVLTVAGLIKETEAVTPKKVQELFKKRIKSIIVDLKGGTLDKAMTKRRKHSTNKKPKKIPHVAPLLRKTERVSSVCPNTPSSISSPRRISKKMAKALRSTNTSSPSKEKGCGPHSTDSSPSLQTST